MSETELEQNQKLALTIRERIETATKSERHDILDALLEKWVVKDFENENILYFLQLALGNFGLTVNNLQLGSFEKAKKIAIFELSYLRLFFMDDADLDESEKDTVIQKTNKIFKSIIDAENALRSSLHLQNSMIEKEIGSDENPDIMRFTPMDTSNNTQYQDLLLFLLEHLMRKGYRRYRDTVETNPFSACYKRVYTDDGYDTHAWTKAMSLQEFIYDVCRRETNYSMWQNLTNSKDNVKGAQAYLSDFLGGEFEDIKRDRHVFSFNNGIYITKKWDEEKEIYVDEWIPYSAAKKLGPTIISCKYFNQEFDEKTREYENWWEIITNHCPNFLKIIEYQEWPEEVQKWLCIMLGRNLYEIGEMGEDWQIIAYLLGLAASGKSSIITQIAKKFYEECDIGTMSNNMEKTFGLGALVDKFMFIGPEIKGDFSMEQSEFQSIISGEDVQVAKKHKTAESVRWNVPGILAGNEVMQYTDNSGSISRRLMVFKFDKIVTKGDDKLKHKLQKEIPYILQASNRAYLEMIVESAGKGIWDILPEYFRKSKDEMAENTNALNNFLKSDKVKLGKDLYVREKDFLTEFNNHCREAHLGLPRWSNQYYLGPFTVFGITFEKNIRKKYPPNSGRYSNGNFICGVDVITEYENRQLTDDEDEGDGDGDGDVEADYEDVEVN